MVKEDFKRCQQYVLFAKRNINAKTETQRLEHVLQYLFHKKQSIYPNVISVMEWYLGMITHVINNERINTTRSWIQSTYRQNISDEILKEMLTVLSTKNNRPPNYFEHALKQFLKKKDD